jgi:hypothetical protein
MSSGRVRFGQIDGLREDTQAVANEGDGLYYDSANEEFVAGPPPSAPLFGRDFNEYEVDGLQSTSSTLYQNYLTFVTPNLPAGNYIVYAGYIVNTTASNVSIEVRTQLDSVDIFNENFRLYGGNTAPANERLYPAHFEVLALSGVHTFTTDFRRQGNNKVVDIYHAHIVLWRVS